MNMRSILAGLACAAASWAAQTEYFPLQAGNQWVLQTTSATPELMNIEVLRSRIRNGETYFLVAGYAPEPRWVRQSADGTLVALDEQSGQEEVLAHFTAGAAGYLTSLGGCQQTAQPPAEPAPYRGPHVEATSSLEIQYAPDSCRDVGITREIYAQDIGLVRRSITTIRGELTFDLVYARVNGAPVLGKSKEIVLAYDFNRGSKGWLAGFSDYNLQSADLRRLAELRPLPDELSPGRSGFYIQGMNRSDDLFMFLKKHVSTEDGLEPNQDYRVWFDIRFASDAPTGCPGVGGSPGDSVYLKAGAAADEPVTSLDTAGDVHLSADKGQQSMGGKDAGVVGTIANGTACEGTAWPYISVRKDYAHPQTVRTDDRGSLWLLVGTDSGYEGLTGLYLESITVRINSAVEPAAAASAGAARR